MTPVEKEKEAILEKIPFRRLEILLGFWSSRMLGHGYARISSRHGLLSRLMQGCIYCCCFVGGRGHGTMDHCWRKLREPSREKERKSEREKEVGTRPGADRTAPFVPESLVAFVARSLCSTLLPFVSSLPRTLFLSNSRQHISLAPASRISNSFSFFLPFFYFPALGRCCCCWILSYHSFLARPPSGPLGVLREAVPPCGIGTRAQEPSGPRHAHSSILHGVKLDPDTCDL